MRCFQREDQTIDINEIRIEFHAVLGFFLADLQHSIFLSGTYST